MPRKHTSTWSDDEWTAGQLISGEEIPTKMFSRHLYMTLFGPACDDTNPYDLPEDRLRKLRKIFKISSTRFGSNGNGSSPKGDAISREEPSVSEGEKEKAVKGFSPSDILTFRDPNDDYRDRWAVLDFDVRPSDCLPWCARAAFIADRGGVEKALSELEKGFRDGTKRIPKGWTVNWYKGLMPAIRVALLESAVANGYIPKIVADFGLRDDREN